MQTINKHIGEGFARGELYAALAYDTSDQFGGIALKQVKFNTAVGLTAIDMVGGVAYIPFQVGVKSSTAGVGFTIASVAADNSGGVQLYADDNGAALASPAEVVSPFRSRYCLTLGQSGGVSQAALFAQLVTVGSLTLNTGCWRAAYIFNQQGTTTIQGGAEVLGINQATTLAGNMTVTSGTFAGIYINIAGAGAISNSSTCAALLIGSAGTPVWSNGIQIKNAGAVTGINLGTCTTSINFGTPSTSVFTLVDDGTIVSITNGAVLADIHGTANAGFIKVVIGTTVRYIAVYAVKTS